MKIQIYFLIIMVCVILGCDPPGSSNATQDDTEEVIRYRSGERCKNPSECTSFVCNQGFCAEPTCKDDTQNGLETATDCGGPICARCPDLQSCLTHDDCRSRLCFQSLCSSAQCQNGTIDGSESDIDCGGSCQSCSQGQQCRWNSDCLQTICGANQRCEPPSCDDDIHNGLEIDTDCGGPCQPCGSGQTCSSASDCIQGAECIGQTCVLPKLCLDLQGKQTKNGLYWVDPDGPLAGFSGTLVYCDMQTDGGGWTLIARSSSPDSLLKGCIQSRSLQSFGWLVQTGHLTNDSEPYSLGIGTLDISFTEVIWGDYKEGKEWGDFIYKHNVPSRFIDTYRSKVIPIGDPIVIKGDCIPSDSMFSWIGFTGNVDFFYFRDLPNNGYGLFSDGFYTCYQDCTRGGMLYGKPGMIMVR